MTAHVTTLQAASMEGRYRLLVDAITDYAIYMLDTEGRISSWNAGARRFKGACRKHIRSARLFPEHLHFHALLTFCSPKRRPSRSF